MEKAPDIRVYFENEDAAVQANRELIISVEEARSAHKTIAFFNGGRQSLDVKKYISSEVLHARQVPGGTSFVV
ncbi:MAG: hypothetical protein ACXVH6_05400 [Halobacteriota archaeon]